jgi:hypothetical protein
MSGFFYIGIWVISVDKMVFQKKGMLFNWEFYNCLSAKTNVLTLTLTPVKMFLWRARKTESRNNTWSSDTFTLGIVERIQMNEELREFWAGVRFSLFMNALSSKYP